MREFRLPDSIKSLGAKTGKLKEELSRRHTEYQMSCAVLPKGQNPWKTPEYRALLVAHRRWQFAYEKLLVLKRRTTGSVPVLMIAIPSGDE